MMAPMTAARKSPLRQWFARSGIRSEVTVSAFDSCQDGSRKARSADMNLWEPRPRQPLAFLALSAMIGIFAADRWSVPPVWALSGLAIIAGIAFLRPTTPACWLLCALAFFTLHTLLFDKSEGRAISELFMTSGDFRRGSDDTLPSNAPSTDGAAPSINTTAPNGVPVSRPWVVRVTGVVWNEPEKPVQWSRNITARFRLKVQTLEIGGESRTTDVLMNIAWAGKTMPEYGDRVSLRGSGKLIEGPRNPGQFDYASYIRRQGVYCEVRATYPTDCQIESHGHGNPAQAFAYRSRHWIQERLAVDLEDSPEAAEVIESIILGLRSDTPEDLKALFQRTGTVHLVAVSGLNVVMLATIVTFLLRPFPIGRFCTAAIVIVTLWAYAMVTGMGASCMRATVMFSLVTFASIFDRRGLSFNSLGAAALALLAWNTNELFSTGFQFSFGVVAVIIACASRIRRFIEPVGMPDAFLPRELWNWRQKAGAFAWRKCAGAVALSMSAWIGSLFFTAGYFHLISLSAMAANIVAVPIAFGVLILGVASLLAAPFWKAGLVLFNNANWLCAKFMLFVLKVFTALPAGYLYVELPRLSQTPEAELTVLDLGDGGAIHLRTAGRDWMIDCGNASGYERIVLPYLRTRGVNRLDGLVLDHGSTRRLGGAMTLLDDFHPGSIAESVLRERSATRTRLNAELARRNLGKGLYERGDAIRLGGSMSLRVLYPPAGLKRSAADDKALVCQFDCDGVRALFMSDSGFSTEQWLIENEPDLRSNILIKGQHSRDFSGTPDFLERVQPQAVICGNLGYGKPVEPLDQWEQDVIERGIAVFRQDHTGSVHIEIDGGRFQTRAFLGGQTFFSRAR